jgi:hypothetical protein
VEVAVPDYLNIHIPTLLAEVTCRDCQRPIYPLPAPALQD